MRNTIPAWLLIGLLTTAASAQNPQAAQRDRSYPPEIDGAQVEVYKTVGDVKLNIYIFQPPGHKASDKRPAIVFFFGGGWTSGSPAQFRTQCEYLASRGMVAMTADYRVASRHQVKAVSCVADGKSAIRWVRANAGRLGVDPNRIAAGGGSAGGHVAACTGTIKGMEESGEDASVSSVPNAMVLFNPAVVLASIDGKYDVSNDRVASLNDRTGTDPVNLSPYHHVSKGTPPTLILHGRADTTVPYKTVELFAEAMTEAGNKCKLAGYDGQPHGFFNLGKESYVPTVREMDQFLVDLGWLTGEPTIGKSE